MSSLKVGTAKADITPPVGTEMAGYIQRKGRSKGVHDRLFAKTLYLDDGEVEAVLVSIDSLAVDRELTQMVIDRVERTAAVSGQVVVLAATHTHSGPSGLAVLSFGGGRGDDLLEFTASRIAETVELAKEEAFEARLKVGSTVVEGISQDRSDPARPIDQQLYVLRIEDTEGRLRAVLANYPCHPTFFGPDNLMISADWPGAVCAVVERVLDEDVVVMVTNGASGNIHPAYLSQSPEDLKRMGQVLGGAITMALGQLWPVGNKLRVKNTRWGMEMETEPPFGRLVTQPRIQLSQQRVHLPLKEFRSTQAYDNEIEAVRSQLRALGFDDESLTTMIENPGATSPASIPCEAGQCELVAQLNALVGERMERERALVESHDGRTETVDLNLLALDRDLAFLFIPGELSSHIGSEIRSRSSPGDLILVTCAGGYVGYLVPAAEYGLGGYNAGVSHFGAQAEAAFIEAALDLIEEVCSEDTH